jgi:hypothetical protein
MTDRRSVGMLLMKVWNGFAASGTDDHILFLEHPELPEHWRPKSGSPHD